MQSFEYRLPLATDMETSFYHDNQRAAVKKMKSNMSLDFFGAPSSKKRATQTTSNLQPGLLGSPDLNMLKLASPELERMIIQQNGMVTTTPTPSQITNPKFVTEEQEAYARGFVDALAELHEKQGDHLQPIEDNSTSAVSSAPVSTMTTLMPPAANMSMSISDIPSDTTMINTVPVAPLSSVVAMSSAGYQSQQPPAAVMTMPYTSTADQMNMSPSHPVVTSCSDMLPSNSQHQYTTLLPPTSQHQQNAYTSLPSVQENSRIVQLKQEEPQIVPNLGFSPPMSPINMANQEKIKLERKRERNRVAARKCRTRKLERISRLEDRVSDLKGQNSDLVSTATNLREQVCRLKSQIMTHVKNGCQVMMSQNLL